MFESLEASYQQLISQTALWVFLGGFLGFLVTLISIKFFPRLGLLDFPERYGLKRNKIPYPGGIGLVFLLPLLLLIDLRFLPLVLGGGVLGVISFIDDRHPLSAILRLLAHVLIATFVWGLGVSIDFITNPFAENNISILPFTWLSWALTVFWILLLQQALNWFDGIKGLSVGISGVGFLVLGMLGLVKPELFFDLSQGPTTIASFFLAAFCFGALGFYTKGRILLGDSGAQVLGFLLATMALVSGAKIATTLLVLSLPCIDLGVVILRRVFIEKKSPFKGDGKHLHHNLARRWGELRTTFILIGVSLVLGLIALFTSGMIKVITLGIAALIILLFALWALKKD